MAQQRSTELLDDGEKEKTLQDLLDAVHRPEGRPCDDFDVKDVVPAPSFVIKTWDTQKRKIFINVCGCAEIPAPGNWAGGQMPPEVAAALRSKSTTDEENEALRFPLSLGAAREDRDKQGEPCIVYDCLFNLDITLAARLHRKLRVFLVGLAIEWVSHKNNVRLSADYKIPKMQYKGKEIRPHRVKIPRGPMVQEIAEGAEATSFPLRVSGDAKPCNGKKEATVQLPKLTYKLTFENRPVDAITVQIPLPRNAGSVEPHVWLTNFHLNVDLPNVAEPLTIEIPFAVDAQDSRVTVSSDDHLLIIKCPFKPIALVLSELRKKAQPSVTLQSGETMDLELVA